MPSTVSPFETTGQSGAGDTAPPGSNPVFIADRASTTDYSPIYGIAPGVFTLGDMGYIDAEGWVYITDRSSDMIVSGGVNIYPAEIEAVLGMHEAVEDTAVIGAPNTDMGEEVKALVVLRPGVSAPDARELDAWCRERLARFKCPRSYEFVETVGRTAMGKINKRALRAPYWPTERTIG